MNGTIDISNKTIIVFGLGITGVSSVKALRNLGAKVVVYDSKKDVKYRETIAQLSP